MKIYAFTLFAIFIFTFSTFGQSELTNNDVIELVKNGLSETIVLAKVRTANAKFDTSIEALKLLTQEKVSDNIIAAMIERASLTEKEVKADAEDAEKAKNAPPDITFDAPENGDLKELADKTKVYFYTDDAVARNNMKEALEKYPRLEVIDKIEKAEFILAYQIVGAYMTSTLIGPFQRITGDLLAVQLGSKDAQGKTHVRIFYSVRKTRGVPADKNAAKQAVQAFIKAIKKVRGEKN